MAFFKKYTWEIEVSWVFIFDVSTLQVAIYLVMERKEQGVNLISLIDYFFFLDKSGIAHRFLIETNHRLVYYIVLL